MDEVQEGLQDKKENQEETSVLSVIYKKNKY